MEVIYCPTCTLNFFGSKTIYLTKRGFEDFDKAIQARAKELGLQITDEKKRTKG